MPIVCSWPTTIPKWAASAIEKTCHANGTATTNPGNSSE